MFVTTHREEWRILEDFHASIPHKWTVIRMDLE